MVNEMKNIEAAVEHAFFYYLNKKRKSESRMLRLWSLHTVHTHTCTHLQWTGTKTLIILTVIKEAEYA